MEPATPRTSLRRLAAPFLLSLGALACLALLASCGGEDADQDGVDSILDRAFRQPIERADLKIDAQLTVDGLKGFERPVRLEANGSYIAGDGRVPQLDVDLILGTQGAGQTVQFGVLRTADRAFVKFGGEFYEQPPAEVRRANRELGDARGRAGALAELGLRPRTWVVGAREEDEEKVSGVRTRHLAGRLDVRVLLRDLNRLVRRSAGAVGGSAADAPAALSTSQLDYVADIVRNPSFDVYVGKEDDVIRRISAQVEVRVPEEDRSRAGGVEGGAVRFAIEFSEIDGDQVVEPPARARPIGDLTRQLGGLSALGGVAGLGGGATGSGGEGAGERTTPAGPPGADAPPGPRGEESDGVEAFRRYSECLDRARPEDTEALSRCAELLR